MENTTSTEVFGYTIKGAEKYSGLSRSELYRRLADGSITAVKNNKRTIIVAESLRRFMESLPPATFRPLST